MIFVLYVNIYNFINYIYSMSKLDKVQEKSKLQEKSKVQEKSKRIYSERVNFYETTKSFY